MISPKDRAEELYNKFEEIFINANADSWGKEAKQCVLILIKEIFDADYPGYPSQSEYDKWSEYWQEVKKEIILISE